MAIYERSDQYKYLGKGPYDAKMLVKKFEDLTSVATWTASNGVNLAYNGMIVAVWMNNDDTSKNGVYVLFDPECTTTLKKPRVDAEYWQKLCQLSDLDSLVTSISSIQESIDELSSTKIPEIEERITQLESEQTGSELVYQEFSQLPTIGEDGKLYICLDKEATYAWDGSKYVCVGSSTLDISIIDGGRAK